MSIPFLNIFKDRSVFITGHTGFKGSWLALWLSRIGAKVTGYSLAAPPSTPNNFTVSAVRELLAAHYQADIRDRERLQSALSAARPDVVLHLAAQSLVRASYAAPHETFDTNVLGTASMLDAVRSLRRPCVVIVVTSDKCYENREQLWGYRETDPLGGFDPYSASKGAAEIVVASYRNSFFNPARVQEHGVKLASVRAGNVIGGGDWAKDRIVTDMVASLAAGDPVQVRNPKAIRPWQHVLEPLSGYLQLAALMLESSDSSLCSGWNFGPRSGDEAPVGVLVDSFCQEWGGGKWQDASDPNQVHESSILRLSTDKALSKLNWKPRWSFQQTVQCTARWYLDYVKHPARNMRDACIADIDRYETAGN